MKKFYPVYLFIITLMVAFESHSQINSLTPYSIDSDLPPLMTSGANIPVGVRYPGTAGFVRNDTAWVYVMAGLQDGNIITSSCYRYNVTTDTWETIAPLSQGGVWIGASVSLGNKIYNLGGTTTLALNQAQSRVEIYNITTGVWTLGIPMTFGRTFLAAATYQDSLIYIAGGWGFPGGVVYNDVYVFNVNSNQWRTCSNMPAPRCGGVLGISSDTMVYICGGPDWTNPAARNTVFRGIISQTDRSVIVWDSLGAVYPPGNRNSIYGANWGSRGIIVSGGYNFSGSTATNQCYSYSPGSNAWTSQPNLLSNRTDHGTASVRVGNIWKFVNVSGTSNRSGVNLTTTNILTDSIPTLVGIEPGSNSIPNSFSLYQNYPNPFNPLTKIKFDVAGTKFVSLIVYDALGREVETLVRENLTAGRYEINFNGNNLPSGIYFYKLIADDFSETNKMILIK